MKKKVIVISSIMIIVIMILLKYYYISYASNNKLYILDNKVQNSIGVNIHFTDPNPNEMQQISDAGFTTIRMDLIWSKIEKEQGVYDFSQYDKLVNESNKKNINILFILDYNNPLYDNGLSPYTDDGRHAFSNFAMEAVKHYKGNPIIWEMWNEPNIPQFWKPNPNIDNYLKLAIDTITAIKSVDKNAFIIAPALSEMDYNFLNYLGKNNFFNYIDALSIHPYRRSNPETVITDYSKINDLINKYPHKEGIKIFCGEWGYSTTWKDIDELKQAQYCIRDYLINLMCGVNLTIWYDWKNDGTDKNNMEHNFGTVSDNLEPKTTYYAIKTLTNTLKDYQFVKRIDGEEDSDYILMFTKGNKTAYAVWTTGQSHEVSIKFNSSKIKVVGFTGDSYDDSVSDNSYKVNISNSVTYLTPM